MQVPDLACKSSQNARKLARLCLSHSNRWLPVFQKTHELAIDDAMFRLGTRKDLTDEQRALIEELTIALYDPAPSL
jgi:hypothetical protein